jgi:hypothetical protein
MKSNQILLEEFQNPSVLCGDDSSIKLEVTVELEELQSKLGVFARHRCDIV